MNRVSLITGLAAVLLCVRSISAVETVSFSREIAPILRDHCLACHDPKSAEGGYRVDSFDELLKPGESGKIAVARKPEETSELLRRLICDDESERMPAESDPLSPDLIERIKVWIEQGASFDGQSSSDPLAIVIPTSPYPDPPETYSQPIPISAICFSPDGQQLLVGGYHELTAWNVADGKLVRRIKNIGQRTFSIAFDPSGKMIAVGTGEPGRSGELRLVNFESGEVTAVLNRTSDVVLSAAFRPGTNQIAVASADGSIRIVDVVTLQEIRTIASHAGAVTAVAWSDDGSRLVSASLDKSAKVFDGESGQLLGSYNGHGASVRGVAVLADGTQVVSSGDDNKLHRWNIEGAKQVAAVDIGGTGFKIAGGSDFVIVPSANERVCRINLSDNQISHRFSGHTDWALSVTINQQATQVASGAFNGEVRLWNLSDGSLIGAWIAKP